MLLGILSLSAAATAFAKPWWMRGVESNGNDFLPPDEAFRVSAFVDGDAIGVRWMIANGYYLYKQRMEVRAESPGLVLSAPVFPRGTIKTDPFQGVQEIYTQQVEGRMGFTRADHGAHPLEIKITYQGCAEAGLCYPPISKMIFPAAAPGSTRDVALIGHGKQGLPTPWEMVAIAGGGLAFLLAGLLLRKGRHLPSPL